jgi:hypothetical protein
MGLYFSSFTRNGEIEDCQRTDFRKFKVMSFHAIWTLEIIFEMLFGNSEITESVHKLTWVSMQLTIL